MEIELPECEQTKGMTQQEHTYQRLRQAIMLGTLRPGRAVTIRGLSEALSTSPTPVREALRRLTADRALLLLPNRRIVVPKMTVGRFEELVALRTTLECAAAQRAMPFVSERLVDQMTRIDGEMDAVIARGDRHAQVLLNQAFHTALYTANPDQVAMPMIESLWLQLGPFQSEAARNWDATTYKDRHKDALAALGARDAEALSAAIRADVSEGVGGLPREAVAALVA